MSYTTLCEVRLRYTYEGFWKIVVAPLEKLQSIYTFYLLLTRQITKQVNNKKSKV